MTPRLTLSLPILAALAGGGLASCAIDPPPPPPRSTAASPGASPGAAPRGPVTEFDGTYAGPMKLNPDRSRTCPQPPAQELTLTVRQGRGTFVVNPAARQTLSGTVGPTGGLRLSDILDRSIATSGAFTEQGFIGEYVNGRCTYSVHLRKAR